MITRYKSAAYHFDPNVGMNQNTIAQLDSWLNGWLMNGYIVDKVTDISKNGTVIGYLFILKQER